LKDADGLEDHRILEAVEESLSATEDAMVVPSLEVTVSMWVLLSPED
jgi:hypothetical protein